MQKHSWDSTEIYLTPFPHGNKTGVMLIAKPNTVVQGSLQPWGFGHAGASSCHPSELLAKGSGSHQPCPQLPQCGACRGGMVLLPPQPAAAPQPSPHRGLQLFPLPAWSCLCQLFHRLRVELRAEKGKKPQVTAQAGWGKVGAQAARCHPATQCRDTPAAPPATPGAIQDLSCTCVQSPSAGSCSGRVPTQQGSGGSAVSGQHHRHKGSRIHCFHVLQHILDGEGGFYN